MVHNAQFQARKDILLAVKLRDTDTGDKGEAGRSEKEEIKRQGSIH